MSLSDKIKIKDGLVVPVKDVKEFIKELKKEFNEAVINQWKNQKEEITKEQINYIIDTQAGDKLI